MTLRIGKSTGNESYYRAQMGYQGITLDGHFLKVDKIRQYVRTATEAEMWIDGWIAAKSTY